MDNEEKRSKSAVGPKKRYLRRLRNKTSTGSTRAAISVRYIKHKEFAYPSRVKTYMTSKTKYKPGAKPSQEKEDDSRRVPSPSETCEEMATKWPSRKGAGSRRAITKG